MTEHPGFDALLASLLDRRGFGAPELADRAGLTPGEVRAVLAGDSPSEELLRLLGPALGFHAVDLFILARLAIPEDLAPLDATAAQAVGSTVAEAVRLSATLRRDLLRLTRSLPQQERCSGFAPKLLAPLDGGPGACVIRMLQYRNLNWSGMAHALGLLTPTYLSASTYGVIGSGRSELTPRLVTDCATLLGIDSCDLAALTGVHLTEAPLPLSPEAAETAALLWEMRRLSAAQAQDVCDVARA
ncbi:hypothetical protein ABZ721_37055 [Streptomyces sp. NPDC006733]|uniref:hypothetical protein n=1 Tax=Streptomyces sp. NPDC006733 TaxID=3155460 RepID=UPI0033DF72A8